MTLVVHNLNLIGETFLICSFPLSGIWASQSVRGDVARRDNPKFPTRRDLLQKAMVRRSSNHASEGPGDHDWAEESLKVQDTAAERRGRTDASRSV